ncbi:MAG: 30S ribosomal protein S8 [Candidatus Marinimicrobia bacterium]|nr:30S ribosomal protein S8 [Candidatus Neomarinimicrobiota bacterium]MBL7046366.1 30S ribosomal protein S8 [Candidatus Neomarinimicrobiota bacterium]
MTMTDPIADLLTRIRNAQQERNRWVDIPASTVKKRIVYILREEHYIKDFIIIKRIPQDMIRIFLKYDHNDDPVISQIDRVSKPGRRVYAKAENIPKVLNGMGIAILTTSKGVISDKVARKLNVGGEIICNIW